MGSIKLYYTDKLFKDSGKADNTLATLEINMETSIATMSYAPEANIADQRTAQRQARGICKTGFLLSNNERIGAGCELVLPGDENLPDRLFQEGYHYK